MDKTADLNYVVTNDGRTIVLERSFNTPLDPIWSAWTEAALLRQWWVPKPYECVIKSLDFREGGRLHYCMQDPQGSQHWAFFDFEKVQPRTYFAAYDGFCDEAGTINDSMPRARWENRFSERDGRTSVKVEIHFASPEELDSIVSMGFMEDFVISLDQLDEILRTTQFFHGTKAELKEGDMIASGFNSNYGQRKNAAWVYFTATLDAATWGAELAQGEGRGRIYIVEPTGHYENDPNLTDQKFPGNPTRSYRTKAALRVTGEVKEWQGHAPEQLQAMKDHLQRLKEQGIEAIED